MINTKFTESLSIPYDPRVNFTRGYATISLNKTEAFLLRRGGEPLVTTLDERALRARQDEAEFTALLKEYRPFILSIVLKHAERAENDLIQAGFLGFHEAVQGFCQQKGSFLSLARTIVTRRVLDHLRGEKSKREVSHEDAEYELSRAAHEAHSLKLEQQERKDEILSLIKELAEVGIRFAELSEVAPKHASTRSDCIRAIEEILSEPQMKLSARNGRLPIANLAKELGIRVKTLERHRKYILAGTIIHSGEYPHIKEYLPLGKEGRV